jgi:hypothetical protein
MGDSFHVTHLSPYTKFLTPPAAVVRVDAAQRKWQCRAQRRERLDDERALPHCKGDAHVATYIQRLPRRVPFAWPATFAGISV